MLHFERPRVGVMGDPEMVRMGMEFLARRYGDTFGVLPSAPDCLIAARVDSEIVGTIGINFANEHGLRLERLYSFDHDAAPYPVDIARTVEIGRWVCDRDGISALLAHTAVEESIARGMAYGWCEHALPLHRVCRRFGVVFRQVNATLESGRIEPCYANYYAQHDTKLYMFELDQARQGLQHYLSR